MKRSRLQLPPKEYKALCNRVMNRDGWKCRHCGYRNNLTCHHVLFRSQGGDDIENNLLTLCDTPDGLGCHRAVHNRYLVILDPSGEPEVPVNTDRSVKYVKLCGWQPRNGGKPYVRKR